MSAKNNKPTISEKTIKLNELVEWFDSDDFELEAALDKFAEAEKLANEIEADLLAMKNTITIVKKKFNEAE
jgi:exodeoxyribonuclease VII small subunit